MNNAIVSKKIVTAFVPTVLAILCVGESHTRSISREKMLAHEGLKNVAGFDLTQYPGTLSDLLNDACESGELVYEGKAGKGSGYRAPGRTVESASVTSKDPLSDDQRTQASDLIGKADFTKEVLIKSVLRPMLAKCETADAEDSLFRSIRSALEAGQFPGYTKEGNTKIVRVAAPVASAVAA